MTNRFVCSDHHFGHESTWAKFKRSDGTPLRPFSSTEEMNEAMVERHNAKVKENDVVYFLGDVVINKKFLSIVDRLNGSKRLIMGNHDIFGDDLYKKYFKKVASYRVFVDDFIFSHIPLHPDCVTDRFKVNVHGHLHANRIMRPGMKQWIEKTETSYGTLVYETSAFKADYSPVIDPRYHCVCVEHTDYAPLSFDELKDRIKKEHEDLGYVAPVKAWGNGSGPG